MFPSKPGSHLSPQFSPRGGPHPGLRQHVAGRETGVGRWVSAWPDRLSLPLRHIPGVPAAPRSPGPAIPVKKGELHYPSGLPPPSFLSSRCTWPEGRAGPGRHSPAFSFPVSERGSFFFFFRSSTPSLPPAPPSLFPSPPSLPCRLGLCAGAPEPLRSRDARNSRLESALPSLLPPFSFPAPFPHPPTRARSGGQRNPEVSIPPSAPLF